MHYQHEPSARCVVSGKIVQCQGRPYRVKLFRQVHMWVDISALFHVCFLVSRRILEKIWLFFQFHGISSWVLTLWPASVRYIAHNWVCLWVHSYIEAQAKGRWWVLTAYGTCVTSLTQTYFDHTRLSILVVLGSAGCAGRGRRMNQIMGNIFKSSKQVHTAGTFSVQALFSKPQKYTRHRQEQRSILHLRRLRSLRLSLTSNRSCNSPFIYRRLRDKVGISKRILNSIFSKLANPSSLPGWNL